MRILNRLFLIGIAALTLAGSGTAATVVRVGEFRSLSLHQGGHVVVRYGDVQRVSILTADAQYTHIRLGDGQQLIIEREGKCPRGYRVDVEVVTPVLSGVSVSNGGTVQVLGTFPAQPSIAASVEQGGTIDIRSIPAGTVDASVESGGRIFTTVRESLRASVHSGGIVSYLGRPKSIRKSIVEGGVVAYGDAGDWDAAIPPVAPIPPLPPIPPVPPVSD